MINKNFFLNVVVPFSIFILATVTQFFFDTFGAQFISDAEFSEFVSTRAFILIFTPFLILGIDQAIIRFGGIPSNLKSFLIFYVLLVALLPSILDYLGVNFGVTLYAIYSLLLYGISMVIGSKYRVEGRNVLAQISINLWRFTSHTSVLILSNYSLFYLDLTPAAVIFYSMIATVIIIILFSNPSQLFSGNIETKEFAKYSFVFMLFIFLLGVSQYYDQLFVPNIFNGDKLKQYIGMIAFFVSPITVISTFIGFLLAPKFSKISIDKVKLEYKKHLKFLSVIYPLLYILIFLLYEFIFHEYFNYQYDLSFPVYSLLFFIGYLRLVYVLNSSVMGMKGGMKNLGVFFLFCLSGIAIQLVIFQFIVDNYSVNGTFEVVNMLILLAVVLNWIVRNIGATYLVLYRI
ncbi:hypothetical protein L2596_000862 [Vibrio vulnificus]|nr:hypothetical protein [Vibrio vulnificus]